MVAIQVAGLRLGEWFCRPPASAIGGYACGTIAEPLGGAVEVTLRRPPPSIGRCRCYGPAASALLDTRVGLLAVARSVWVTVPRPEPAP